MIQWRQIFLKMGGANVHLCDFRASAASFNSSWGSAGGGGVGEGLCGAVSPLNFF